MATSGAGAASTVAVVVEEAAAGEERKEPEVVPYVLRRVEDPPRKHIRWGGEVVDNEHLGKKSSKVCCQYHKPRAFDESDSEESDYEAPPNDYARHHGGEAPDKDK